MSKTVEKLSNQVIPTALPESESSESSFSHPKRYLFLLQLGVIIAVAGASTWGSCIL